MRRRAEAQERHRTRRLAIGRAWAEHVIEQLVEASANLEDGVEIEAGIVDGNRIGRLKRCRLPAEYFRNLVLLRPLVVDGLELCHVRTGPLAADDGWLFQYESGLTFLLHGDFSGDTAPYRTALAQLKLSAVVQKAPPDPKWCGLRRFHAEELSSERLPMMSFLLPFHPSAATDAALKEAEDEVVQAFWRVTR